MIWHSGPTGDNNSAVPQGAPKEAAPELQKCGLLAALASFNQIVDQQLQQYFTVYPSNQHVLRVGEKSLTHREPLR